MMLNRLLDIGNGPPHQIRGHGCLNELVEVCHMDSYNHTLVFPRSLRVYTQVSQSSNNWLPFY
jgi:hypothetical protein